MIDELIRRIDELDNPTVVGLDPTPEIVPEHLINGMIKLHGKTPKAMEAAFTEFNRAIIDAVRDIVPAVKPQIAMYEKYGMDGIASYIETVGYAKLAGMTVIGDIKRGDISSTAEAYAAHIGGTRVGDENYDLWLEDAVTINPYLGYDGIEPFVRVCKENEKGIFVLVKTSNKSGADIQNLILKDTGRPLYERVGELVDKWGSEAMGTCGFSKIGAVVGATYPEEGEALRKLMPRTFFLVPGYGAQGGKAEDIARFFDADGRGCIINSSRGIIGAYKKDKVCAEHDFAEAARKAAIAMRDDINGAKRSRR